MNKAIVINQEVKSSFAVHASKCAVGVMIQKLKLFAPIIQKVKIPQKVVKCSTTKNAGISP